MNILEEIKNNLNEITKNIELILKIEFENEMNLLRKDDLYFNFYKSLLANINIFEHKNKNGVTYIKTTDLNSIIVKTGSKNTMVDEFNFYSWLIKKNLTIGYKIIKLNKKQYKCIGLLN